MSTSVTFNGVSYTIPALSDASWGTNVANYLIAIASGCLQKTGGTFTLTAEVNFGATYGLKTAYLKTQTTNIAAAGWARLAKTDTISWRNNANGADLALAVSGSDKLTFNGVVLATLSTGFVVPSMGGTGVANNDASTITVSGAYGLTLTLSNTTSLTLPTTGTVATTSNKLSAFAATTSLELKGVISDETGSGALVFADTPTLATPVLGVATATSINKMAITTPATSSTLAVADGKTLTASNTLTFTGNDGSSAAFGAGGTVAYKGTDLSQFAATTSLQLAGVISDETGSGKLTFATSPQFSTNADLLAAGEFRFYNSGNTFYTGFKGGAAAGNKIWTLPTADGSSSQVLSTDGSGTLSWASALTNPMTAAQDLLVGGASGAATRVASALLGDIKSLTPVSASYAVTSASPGVFTVNSHGMSTGDKAYVTVTQNGFTANTTYYVNNTGANTFTLCTTLANAIAGTGITSSGTTAGTVVSGGLVLTSGVKGTQTNDSATAGYVGEYKENYRNSSTPNLTSATWTSVDTGNATFNDGSETGIALTPGDWDIQGSVFFLGAAGTTASQAIVSIGTAKGTSTTGVDSNGANYAEAQCAMTAPVRQTLATPVWRVSISAATTYYLKANITFAVSTLTAQGILRARRIR